MATVIVSFWPTGLLWAPTQAHEVEDALSLDRPAGSAAHDPALVDLCHVLFNCNEFMYVD